MLPTSTPAPDSPERLIFVCSGCGLALSAELRHAGVSGPCPSCGAPVNAPGIDQIRGQATSSSHRKGGIVADSALDHLHSDRRETAKSLWIFALFIFVMGACLAVTWFLKNWVSK